MVPFHNLGGKRNEAAEREISLLIRLHIFSNGIECLQIGAPCRPPCECVARDGSSGHPGAVADLIEESPKDSCQHRGHARGN